MEEYSKRLVEVDEIINHLSNENYLKIPEDIRQVIKDNKDKNYVWKYDETKKLDEQNLSIDTIALLSYINTEYLLNEEQKQTIMQYYKLNQQKLERIRKEKYVSSEIIKNDSVKQIDDEIGEKTPVVKKEDNFFSQLLNKIFKLFNK